MNPTMTKRAARLTVLALHAVGERDEKRELLARRPEEGVRHDRVRARPALGRRRQHRAHQVLRLGQVRDRLQVAPRLRPCVHAQPLLLGETDPEAPSWCICEIDAQMQHEQDIPAIGPGKYGFPWLR